MNNALFGHRLRTYRKEKGLTIEKLAEQVGLSPNYLGDVERGKNCPAWRPLSAWSMCWTSRPTSC